jgi:hypothetical protein
VPESRRVALAPGFRELGAQCGIKPVQQAL